jgi:aspartokinase
MMSFLNSFFSQGINISYTSFSALASLGVNSIAISTSISSASCVGDAGDVEAVVDALIEAFEAPHQVK